MASDGPPRRLQLLLLLKSTRGWLSQRSTDRDSQAPLHSTSAAATFSAHAMMAATTAAAAAAGAFAQTHTSEQQHALELKVSELYADLADVEDESERDELLLLLRERHARYLAGGLGVLPGGFISLDASRPWIVYWVLHGLALLQQPLPPPGFSSSDVVAFLSSCQHPSGGFGGGPGQLPHLAPTYAAVGALLTLGGEQALASIDRTRLFDFLCRMAVPPAEGGGFRMHEGGECDVRSCYTALAVASNLRLDVDALVARSGCVDYVRRCQTYEGGLGGEPGNEAHGGYTFCGLAALLLARQAHALDLRRLLRWAVQRQGWVEGGFNGRTNKLVDGCYSFWQGGAFPLLQTLLQQAQQQVLQPPPPLQTLDSAACPAAAFYPPTQPPSAWKQQQQQLEVPELPDLSRVAGPLEQATRDAERLNAACDALTDAALRAAGAAQQQQEAAAAAGGADEEAAGAAAGDVERRRLLERAQAAQQAAEYADENVAIAAASAAVLFPCCDAAAALGAAAAAAAAAGDEHDAAGTSASAGGPREQPNPLFNTRALQGWVLRACQQLKGGLRDKPGKPADYYHSCYCLSGLAAAQHIPGGGGAAGGRRNGLAAADPVVNIVQERLEQAHAFFDALDGRV